MSTQEVLQSIPKEMKTDSGVAHKDRSALATQLSGNLADTYLLYLKTQNVHWNVVGPLFYSVHKLTESQYQDMAEAIDSLAERIRAIGFVAPGSFVQFSKHSDISEMTNNDNTETMIQQLVEDNDTCSRNLRATVVEAEAVGDVKTADLLTERIGAHEESSWMLRALMS